MQLCTLMDKSYFNIFINSHEMNFYGIGFPLWLVEETSQDFMYREFPFSTCQHSNVIHVNVKLFAHKHVENYESRRNFGIY
jgi:hypothetical protein